MLQKEVADKATALPGQEIYGPTALAGAWFGEVKKVLDVGPEYFTPPPPVDSCLIAFRRLPRDPDVNGTVLWLIIRGLFNQRRKNLLNGLKSLAPFVPAGAKSWGEVLEETGIDYRSRPGDLSLAKLAAIAKAANPVVGKTDEGTIGKRSET